LLAFIFGVLSCSSAPRKAAISVEEQVREDVSLGGNLAKKVDRDLKILPGNEFQHWIEQLATKLGASDERLKITPFSVVIYRPKPHQEKLGFSIPAGRIYIPEKVLRGFHHENELAAFLAIELGHLSQRHFVRAVGQSETDEVVFWGPEGVLQYPIEVWESALEVGIQLLYRAGFDLRGVRKALEYLSSLDEDRGPARKLLWERRKSLAKERIVEYAPLRNPIISSPEYLRINRKFERLHESFR
jgi:predicted Zn-dependent protease